VTSNRIRPPAVLAKMAATVDRISGGRLVFGIGAGGSRVPDPAAAALVQREHGAYGLDVPSPGEAVAALGEACTLIRRMWTEEEPFDFDGRWYRLKGAVCEPKPVQQPHPPVLIGAGGERALRVVAEHADLWNCPARTAEELHEKSRVLDEACAAFGRDPGEIERSKQVLVARDDTAGARRQLLDAIEAGCTHLVLAPLPPWAPGTATWLAEEIAEPVRAEAAARG
jgi:alkanesulfonate monooxygenase SsuD/methylene tetrahydromethanopterin reductase-like flavin-dependent oxidoreductase (luciferase family)